MENTKQLSNDIKKIVWYAAMLTGGPVFLQNKYYSASIYPDKRKPDEKSLKEFTNSTYESYWSYYGGGPQYDVPLAIEFIESIKSGIDWDKTKELEDEKQSKFRGTGNSSDTIPILVGIVYTNDDKYYPWVTDFKLPLNNLMGVLKFVKTLENHTEEELLLKIIERFEKIVTDKYPYWEFSDLLKEYEN